MGMKGKRKKSNLSKGDLGKALRKNTQNEQASAELDPNKDEIDQFYETREKALLKESDSDKWRRRASELKSKEQGVFNLNLEDDDEEEENERYNIEDEESSEEEDNNEEDDLSSQAWGREKATFYTRDTNDFDENLAKEEEVEAISIQKKKAAALSEEDFEDSFKVRVNDVSNGKNKDTNKPQKKTTKTTRVKDEGEDGDGDVVVENLVKNVSTLSTKQKLEFLEKESPELLQLLNEFKERIQEIKEVLLPILQKVKNGQLETSKGISFLEVKHHLLLNYCINISFYLLLKAEGKSVKDHPVIEQLVKIRTIIEKLKPIDLKLKHQVDKLLKTASSGRAHKEANDPLALKPNPSRLIPLGQNDDNSQEENDGIYRPPKLISHTIDVVEEQESKIKDRHDQLKQKKRIANSVKNRDILNYIREIVDEEPEEITTSGFGVEDFQRDLRAEKDFEELEAHEEETFNRAVLSKKQANRFKEANRKRLAGDLDGLDILGSYHNIDNVEEDEEEDFETMVESKLKASKKQKSNQIEESESEIEEDGEGEEGEGDDRRKVNSKIQGNRGVVRPRNKKFKTPHLRNRERVKKGMAKHHSMVQPIRDSSRPYTGEHSINKALTKTRKL